jgi:multiple sugar transport system permease protein
LTLYPFAQSIIWSFYQYDPAKSIYKFIGLGNFSDYLLGDRFLGNAVNTFTFAFSTTGASFLIGLIVALVLNRKLRGTPIFRVILLLPLMMAPVAAGLFWKFLYNADIGLIPQLLSYIGIPRTDWTANPSLALFSVVVVDLWEWTPFMILLLLAGMQAIPLEPYESARIDGASSWQLLTRITLPQMKSTIAIAVLIRFMDALRAFDILWMLTQGGPGRVSETISVTAFIYLYLNYHVGYSAAIAVIMIIITTGISMGFVRYLTRK